MDPPQPQLTLAGALDHPGAPTLSDIQAQPPITQTVSFTSGTGSQTHTYTLPSGCWRRRLDLPWPTVTRLDGFGSKVLRPGSTNARSIRRKPWTP
jgi:hypothetical protein